jgi:predicted nucleic acid-binding protein
MVLVDTNVLLDIMEDDPRWADWSYAALDAVINSGEAAAINPVVYAELSVYHVSKEILDSEIASLQLAMRAIPLDGLFLAGKAFGRYRASGGTKSNVLPDFFIGAHAAVEGATVLTRDPRRIRGYFPTVTLVSP